MDTGGDQARARDVTIAGNLLSGPLDDGTVTAPNTLKHWVGYATIVYR